MAMNMLGGSFCPPASRVYRWFVASESLGPTMVRERNVSDGHLERLWFWVENDEHSEGTLIGVTDTVTESLAVPYKPPELHFAYL